MDSYREKKMTEAEKLKKEVIKLCEMVENNIPSFTNDALNRQFVYDFFNGVGQKHFPPFGVYSVMINENTKHVTVKVTAL